MPTIAISRCSTMTDYESAIRETGADLRVFDPTSGSPRSVLQDTDALLLTGGGDVRPALYGAVAHRTSSAAEPGRDEYELELARQALAADVPLLAICRGLQVLNVACGGTLLQHLPEDVGTGVAHMDRSAPDAIAHPVVVEGGTLLASLMSSPTAGCSVPVNSRHHQAPGRVGDGLSVVAAAPDGVIEALEARGQRFCLAVQWHPENFWRTGEFAALFNGLTRAARR